MDAATQPTQSAASNWITTAMPSFWATIPKKKKKPAFSKKKILESDC
jgi:hypothetical protein